MNHIAEKNIKTIADKLDMSYDFYIKQIRTVRSRMEIKCHE